MHAKDEPQDPVDDTVVVGDETVPATIASAKTPPEGPNDFEMANTKPPVKGYFIRHRTLKQLPGIFVGIMAIAVLCSGTLGYVLGKRGGRTVTVTASTNMTSREAVARRNVVWRVLNHDGAALPDSPEKHLGQAIDALIGKDSDIETRQAGFTAFIRKTAPYFDEAQSEAVTQALTEGTSAQVAEAFSQIVTVDGEASDLLRGVMADKNRINSVVAGKRVPLETMPDGSMP